MARIETLIQDAQLATVLPIDGVVGNNVLLPSSSEYHTRSKKGNIFMVLVLCSPAQGLHSPREGGHAMDSSLTFSVDAHAAREGRNAHSP